MEALQKVAWRAPCADGSQGDIGGAPHCIEQPIEHQVVRWDGRGRLLDGRLTRSICAADDEALIVLFSGGIQGGQRRDIERVKALLAKYRV